MKAKSKLALFSALIGGLGVASSATATYAWFVTNNAVTLNYSNISVTAENTHIRVHLYDVNETGAFENGSLAAPGSNTFSNPITISAASGYDGFHFTEKDVDARVSSLNLTEAKKRVFTFGAVVECLASSVEQKVTLKIRWDANSSSNSASVKLSDWIRASVRSVSGPTFDSPDNVTNVYFVKDRNVEQKYLNSDGSLVEIPTDYTMLEKSGSFTIGTYTETTFYYLRISVWMEGTLSDEQDLARGGGIKFAAVFNGDVTGS